MFDGTAVQLGEAKCMHHKSCLKAVACSIFCLDQKTLGDDLCFLVGYQKSPNLFFGQAGAKYKQLSMFTLGLH